MKKYFIKEVFYGKMAIVKAVSYYLKDQKLVAKMR